MTTQPQRDAIYQAAERLRHAAALDGAAGRSDIARILWRNAVMLRRLGDRLQ